MFVSGTMNDRITSPYPELWSLDFNLPCPGMLGMTISQASVTLQGPWLNVKVTVAII